MTPDSFSLQLALAAPVNELEAWIDYARPGDSAMYASGVELPRRAEGVMLVKRWISEKRVTAKQMRDPADSRRTLWLVEKLAAHPAGAARLGANGAAASARAGHEITARTRRQSAELLELLREAAARSRACPTNGELARALGISGARGRDRARYLLRRLLDEGAIALSARGPNEARMVTITAKGPACGKSTRPAARVDFQSQGAKRA